jgi:hypothetical protein
MPKIPSKTSTPKAELKAVNKEIAMKLTDRLDLFLFRLLVRILDKMLLQGKLKMGYTQYRDNAIRIPVLINTIESVLVEDLKMDNYFSIITTIDGDTEKGEVRLILTYPVQRIESEVEAVKILRSCVEAKEVQFNSASFN